MKIQFCDLCNESVPQSDLDGGRAVFRKGRVICAACEAAMSGGELHPETAPGEGTGEAAGGSHEERAAATAAMRAKGGAAAPARPEGVTKGGSGGLWVGLVALVFAAAGLAFVTDAVNELGRRIDQTKLERAKIERSAELRHASFLERMERERQALDQRVDDRVAAQDASVQQVAELVRKTSSDTGERIASLADDLSELQKDLRRRTQRSDKNYRDLTDSLLRIEEDMRFHADRLAQMELVLENADAHALAPGGAAAGQPASPRAPAWQGLVADLQSPNAGIRWEAVDALGQTRDPAVVEHLVPMLKDVDLFVRMGAARVLGDLDAVRACGELIEALEDPEAAMREAAVVSLRKITSRNFKFDPLAKESERSKRVKSWQAWWKKEGQELLGGDA